MEFLANELYHIYNRGNNKQIIFFRPENYLYFLEKVRRYLLPYCDLLAYSLLCQIIFIFLFIQTNEQSRPSSLEEKKKIYFPKE